MLTLYKLILNLAYAVMQPYFILKRLKVKDEWSQRCVIKPDDYLPSTLEQGFDQQKRGFGPCLCLFHASSVGEVRVLERLVKSVKSANPDIKYCISTYTRTGQKLARELFPDAEAVFFFPLDSYFPLKRFFSLFHPDSIIIVETEIWPYFLDFCRKKNIPVILANGRLSEKSTKHYIRFRSLLKSLFSIYKIMIMQTEADRKRMINIGADPDKVVVMGNIKHDPNSDIDPVTQRAEIRTRLNISENQLLLVAASTRPGEEETICKALEKIDLFPGKLKLLLAPRHLERLDEVIGVLDNAGIEYSLYSDIENGLVPQTPIILMDKIGILAKIFYGADLSFVGGTLADLGGHNIMEPVLAGVPVLFGPSIFNVTDAADQIVKEKQGMMVHDGDELAEIIKHFVSGSLTFRKIDTTGPSVAEQTATIIIRELGL